MIVGKLLKIFPVSSALDLATHLAQPSKDPNSRRATPSLDYERATYASQTKPEATKPNSVVSASVGPSPPSTKNIPPDPRF